MSEALPPPPLPHPSPSPTVLSKNDSSSIENCQNKKKYYSSFKSYVSYPLIEMLEFASEFSNTMWGCHK